MERGFEYFLEVTTSFISSGVKLLGRRRDLLPPVDEGFMPELWVKDGVLERVLKDFCSK